MNKLTKKYGVYEYFYLFIMVVFMAQISPEVRNIFFTTSAPLRFIIPLVLTIILVVRNKVSFRNKWFGIVLLFFFIWFIAYSIKIMRFGGIWFPLGVINISIIIVYAYIHTAVFGKDLLIIFERIMVVFAVISLILYLFQLVLPQTALGFFSMFPDTKEDGYNFLYLYKYFYDVTDRDFYSGIVRNSGCSWEPGRFSIMLIFAICVNIFRHGKITFNRDLIILNIALLSTFSTTGIIILLLVYFLFSIKRFSISSLILIVAVFIPLGFYIFSLDFIETKLTDQFSTFSNLDTFIQHQTFRDEETQVALERIPSIGIEFRNWQEEPILGYGHWANSWLYNYVTEYVTTCGGLIQVFSNYGILLGAFFYFCLYKSSKQISTLFGFKNGYIIFIVSLLSSISYPVFGVIFFTSIWFFGLFNNSIEK